MIHGLDAGFLVAAEVIERADRERRSGTLHAIAQRALDGLNNHRESFVQ